MFAMLVAGVLAPAIASAQTYPAKPIRMIVPFGAGGGNDTLARVIGHKLTERWGQAVVVDNKPGAGSNIGMELAAKSPPDGYTLAMAANNLAINPSLYAKMTFDPVKDLAPVSLVASAPVILVVHPSVPANTVAELIALAAAKPGSLNYASSGVGSPQHLAAELFKSMANVDMMHVPYKGAAPSLTAMLAGEVSVYFGPMAATLPHVKAGKLKALAIASAQRSALAPELHTVAETGLPGYDVDIWYGVVAPAGTPRDIVAKVSAEIVAILALPDIREKLSAQGFEPTGSTPEQFAELIKTDRARWEKVIKAAGIRAD